MFYPTFSGWLLLLLTVLVTPVTLAQRNPTKLTCAAPNLTDAQRKLLDREAAFALSIKRSAANAAPTAITYVPIRPHIFRTAAGTGGMPLAKMNAVMGATNSYYLLNGFGIQFYFCGTTPDYIDTATAAFDPNTEDATVAGRDVPNAMNMYFVDAFTDAGLGGYAYFPANAGYSTRSFILNESDVNDLGNRLLPHELGHNFHLYHTFQGSTSANAELVTRGTGTNCTSAGDLVCDTPADPYNRPGAAVSYQNGCAYYSGTATDPTGTLYSPSITNIMSYYFPCTHDFSEGQYDRMAAGLALRQSHTAYSLTCAPTAVVAPANLVAALSTNAKTVMLTWQDLATNEMGYFVERSTRPMDGFGAVGGVGPGETTYTDQLPGRGRFYYRIRPSNSTTGSLSPTVNVVTSGCRPTYQATCQTTNGLAGVSLNGTVLSTASGCSPTGYSQPVSPTLTVGAGQRITVATTFLNATTALRVGVWVDLNRDSTFSTGERMAVTTTATTAPASVSFVLPAGLLPGTLPIRVLTATGSTPPADPCGNYPGGETEDYGLLVQVAPNCPAPDALTASAITGNSVRLAWSAAGGPFAIQYRPQNTPAAAWTTLGDLPTAAVTINGLLANTAYEWQVLAVCGSAGSSALSVLGQFTTACPLASGLTTTGVAGNVAQLNWNAAGGGLSYTVEWKPQNAATWTSLTAISQSPYTLSGLIPNTAYAWRVATVCPGNGATPFSAPASFTTNSQLVYCRPTSDAGCTDQDGLASVVLSTSVLSANSGCSPGAYLSVTTVGGTVQPGQTYSFTATYLGQTFFEGLAIWLDANQNGTFDPAERLFQTPALTTGGVSGTFTVPLTALPGTTTLRFRVVYNQTPTDPCVASEWGETEDYRLLVLPVCATPTPLSTGRITATTATVSWLVAGRSVGHTLRWRVAGSGAVWTERTGPNSFTTSELTGLIPATAYEFQARSQCEGGSFTAWSGSGTFNTLALADLSLAMQVTSRTPALTDAVICLLTLRNDGPNAATNVRLESLLPPNLTFAGSNLAAVTGGPSAVSVVVPGLAAFTSETYSFSLQPTATGTFRVAAQVVAATAEDPDSYANSGTADGEDDAALVDFRTRETNGATVFDSPNPNQRPLPAVVSSQPAPNPAEADLSLLLRPDSRTPLSGAGMGLLITVANRGGLGATGVRVTLTLPPGWLLSNPTGAVVNGQEIMVPFPAIATGQTASVLLTLQTSGTGEQQIRAVISAADQPDLDSVHTNAWGQGEDDEAQTSVRVR